MFHKSKKADPARDYRFTLDSTVQLCKAGRPITYTLDVAACEQSHLAPEYYSLDRGEDGLSLAWFGTVWCNPPWSDLQPWVNKAWREWGDGRCDLIHMLLPVRCEQPFWQLQIEPHRDQPNSPLKVRFLPKRQRFGSPSDPLGIKAGSPPFICCLLEWS